MGKFFNVYKREVIFVGPRIMLLVSWCFEPSQPQKITSGLPQMMLVLALLNAQCTRTNANQVIARDILLRFLVSRGNTFLSAVVIVVAVGGVQRSLGSPFP